MRSIDEWRSGTRVHTSSCLSNPHEAAGRLVVCGESTSKKQCICTVFLPLDRVLRRARRPCEAWKRAGTFPQNPHKPAPTRATGLLTPAHCLSALYFSSALSNDGPTHGSERSSSTPESLAPRLHPHPISSHALQRPHHSHFAQKNENQRRQAGRKLNDHHYWTNERSDV